MTVRVKLILWTFMTMVLPLCVFGIFLFLSIRSASTDMAIQSMDQREALNILDDMKRQLTVGGALLVLGILLLLAFASIVIVKPVNNLRQAVRKIANKDFSMPSSVTARDEFGDLSRDLNAMLTNMQRVQVNLEQQAQEKTSALKSAVEKFEEKNRMLEEAQRAMTNLLEDIEKERAQDEALLRSIGDGVVAVDEKGKVIFMNDSAAKIYDLDSKEILGKPFEDIIVMRALDNTVVPKASQEMAKIIRAQKRITLHAIGIFVKRDGVKVPLAITASSVMRGTKNIGGVGIFRDITKEMEVDRAKTEFVSLASHQLRTPLSTINWYLEMLLAGDGGKLKEKQKKFLEEVYRGNQRMVDLVNALLNVSRLEMGTFIVEPKDVDIRDLMQRVLMDFTQEFKRKKLHVKESYDKLPLLSVDPRLMRIICENFVSNAVKYTPNHGTIAVEIRQTGTGITDGSVRISVRDTGYGIPKAQQSFIFTKLFRADNVRQMDTQGTGLGLYIVKSIIEATGGRVWFESEENQGTAFFVELPLSGMKAKAGLRKLDD